MGYSVELGSCVIEGRNWRRSSWQARSLPLGVLIVAGKRRTRLRKGHQGGRAWHGSARFFNAECTEVAREHQTSTTIEFAWLVFLRRITSC